MSAGALKGLLNSTWMDWFVVPKAPLSLTHPLRSLSYPPLLSLYPSLSLCLRSSAFERLCIMVG